MWESIFTWFAELVDDVGFAGFLLDWPRWARLILWVLAAVVVLVLLVAVVMVASGRS